MQKSIRIILSLAGLLIAVGALVVNFNMVAEPMSKMTGGGESIGNFQISDIAALIIVIVELSMGIFLLSALRKVQIYPVINALPDELRLRMAWTAGVLLFLLATIEAGLVFMESVLLAEVPRKTLELALAGEMAVAFLLPFTSLVIAYALNSLVDAVRNGKSTAQPMPPNSAT